MHEHKLVKAVVLSHCGPLETLGKGILISGGASLSGAFKSGVRNPRYALVREKIRFFCGSISTMR